MSQTLPLAGTMWDTVLSKRHAHTGSTVAEGHHAMNCLVRSLFWYIIVVVVIFLAVRRLVAILNRNWKYSPHFESNDSMSLTW